MADALTLAAIPATNGRVTLNDMEARTFARAALAAVPSPEAPSAERALTEPTAPGPSRDAALLDQIRRADEVVVATIAAAIESNMADEALCSCIDAYRLRDLIDPQCTYHDVAYGDGFTLIARDVAAALAGLLGTRGEVMAEGHDGETCSEWLSPGWWAACSCGWKSAKVPTTDDADALLADHYREIRGE